MLKSTSVDWIGYDLNLSPIWLTNLVTHYVIMLFKRISRPLRGTWYDESELHNKNFKHYTLSEQKVEYLYWVTKSSWAVALIAVCWSHLKVIIQQQIVFWLDKMERNKLTFEFWQVHTAFLVITGVNFVAISFTFVLNALFCVDLNQTF